jgi:hypothetical protein
MSTPTQLRPGLRLRSQVCDTEVIVVRPGAAPLDLRCGGAPMTAFDAEPAAGGTLRPEHSGGTLLGKRYTTGAEGGPELLVTRAGAGSLSDGDTPLVFKEAKPLPASD